MSEIDNQADLAFRDPKSGPKINCLIKLDPKDYRLEIFEVGL